MQLLILKSFFPEFFLSISLILLLLYNSYLTNKLALNFPLMERELFTQTFFIVLCALILALNSKVEGHIYGWFLLSDCSSSTVRILFLLSCVLSLIVIWRGFTLQNLNFFEFFVLYLLSILSSLLLISSYDFLSLYLVLELQSIVFYILASFSRKSSFSSEAGLKYFISSTAMSGIFLFSCSIIYGCLGTLNFSHISLLLVFPFVENLEYLSLLLQVGIFGILIVFLFKLVVAPLHFWFPQVYDGAPLGSTIIFSIVPKLIMFVVLVRLLLVVPVFISVLMPFLVVVGAYSAAFGALLALKQRRLKKLFIYSSIGQLGLPIAAISFMTYESVAAIFFFLVIYLLTSMLIWGAYLMLALNRKKMFNFYSLSSLSEYLSIRVTELTNLFQHSAVWAFLLVLIFFSLAGIPPLSGFLAKFFIYFSLVQSAGYDITTLLLCISVYATFYYLKIIKVSFFENRTDSFEISFFEMSPWCIDYFIYSLLGHALVFFFFFPTVPFQIGAVISVGFFSV